MGGANQVLGVIRSVCLASGSEKANSKTVCAVLCAASGIITILTWESWISLLPFGWTIASTVGGFSYNPRTIRIAGMFFNSPLWMEEPRQTGVKLSN